MINTILDNIKILEFLPEPLVRATFIFLLVVGVIFFLTRSYDMKNEISINDFPISNVNSICLDNGFEKECIKYQDPKKIRIIIINQPQFENEKVINIQTSK